MAQETEAGQQPAAAPKARAAKASKGKKRGKRYRALALKVDAPLVHYRLGLCFMDLGLPRESTECFRTAISLVVPATSFLEVNITTGMMSSCGDMPPWK